MDEWAMKYREHLQITEMESRGNIHREHIRSTSVHNNGETRDKYCGIYDQLCGTRRLWHVYDF